MRRRFNAIPSGSPSGIRRDAPTECQTESNPASERSTTPAIRRSRHSLQSRREGERDFHTHRIDEDGSNKQNKEVRSHVS